MAPGTYSLLVELAEPTTIPFGAADEHELAPGGLVYTGSAFGPGGLSARLRRHAELARGERQVRHWHIDHLLGHPASQLAAVGVTPAERAECELHASLSGAPVDGLGASDCACSTHLRVYRELEVARDDVQRVHARCLGAARIDAVELT